MKLSIKSIIILSLIGGALGISAVSSYLAIWAMFCPNNEILLQFNVYGENLLEAIMCPVLTLLEA